MTSSFRYAHLVGDATQSSDVADLLRDEFDVMLLVPSWDTRCLSVAGAKPLSANQGIVVLLAGRDKQGLRDRHDAQLASFASEHARTTAFVSGEANGVQGLWNTLREGLAVHRERHGKPLRLLMDISTCPRYLFLAVLAWAMSPGMCQSISFFYTEANYPSEPKGQIERHEIFTKGRWNTIPIAGLEGVWNPGHPDLFFVSVGFEGAKTLRTVSTYDPDRVEVLLPDPGFKPEYPIRTWESNKAFFELYGVTKERVVRAPAGDAIAAWRALSERALEREEENVYYVCCGTKPHALAMGLRAAVLPRAAVLYNLPDARMVVNVQPGELFWRYDITNVASIG